MYCLANLFAEQDRRQEMVEEIIREQTIRDLLADKRPFNPLLYTLGKQLSNAGERLQARYGRVAARTRPRQTDVSYRFN
jgi:hypothetical protein